MARKDLRESQRGGLSTPTRIILIILGMMIVFTLALIIYAGGLGGQSKDPDDTTMITLEVPEGSTTDDIGDMLEKEGIVESANAFKLFSVYKKYDGRFQAGVYALSPSMTNEAIAKILASGKTNEITFTIPEGFTEYDVAEKLAQEGLVDEKEFTDLLETGDFSEEFPFLKDAQKGKHKLEGYLFPDTYVVPANATGDDIITAMLTRYQEVFTDDLRQRADELGYTENEIVVIASLIEKEAQVDEERPTVASVIYNRLKDGMPLQIDATVQYVLSLDGEIKEDLLYSDTEIDSKYNTYQNDGIPPGPICSPGEASIQAALYPEETDYFYYVLSDKLDGTHAFSADEEEFEKNKDKYYEAREKADE